MEAFQPPQSTKVLRVPNLKRGKQDERISDRIKLERVLGVTVGSNAALDTNVSCGTVAYPAGCTVVLFNTISGQQSHIINSSRKSITSLAFSSCGRYLVTGECGHLPAVRVWDLQSEPLPGQAPGMAPQVQQVAEFSIHKHGVNCVAFSPTNKYVVSIGTQHDMIVNVWDWRNNLKVASNKVSTKVKAVAFAENGSYFVTVGNRLVKFWFLEYGNNKYNKEVVPIMGRSAILGDLRNNYFYDVACGKAQCGDSTYAITKSGLLCEFNNRRLLDKWVELRTTSANCLTVGENLIFVGCADGIIRCFEPSTLKFITTLPRTHYLGVDVSLGLHITHMSSPPPEAKYPDTIAISYDEINHKLTCIYNDHSIYVWDVHNIKRVGKSHSFLYHSACIWGVEMTPPNSPFPPGSFLTCSSDDTIRVWALDPVNEQTSKGIYRKNIYSNDLLKVVYVDKELNFLKDLDSTLNVNLEKQETAYDGKHGVRSIRISPDGKNLASGDRSGNVRIHETDHMSEICKIEAHDAEVLCLEYTGLDTEHKLLASASRDRYIHVFDVNREYNFLQTLADHSSSIMAVRFMNSPHGNLQMASCCADKSLIFRSLTESTAANVAPQFERVNIATGKTTLYDMVVDASQKHVLTACNDRNVRIYSVGTAKHTKTFKGSTGDDGTLIKVALDRSGIYLASSCTDKSLSVYDYYTGECMATMCGHSELATGLRFTNDCRRLISASGDGCIFVWKVPHDMVVTMHARLSQQAMRQGKTLELDQFSDASSYDFFPPQHQQLQLRHQQASPSPELGNESDYRFSIGALPQWAKKHISDDPSPPSSMQQPKPANLPATGAALIAPKGRWAQRAERNVSVKTFYGDNTVQFSTAIRTDSDGSKDSSLDSGTETARQYKEVSSTSGAQSVQQILNSGNVSTVRGDSQRRVTLMTDDSALGSLRDPDVEAEAHDGDIDSDQEYKSQPVYYPSQQDSASGSEFTVTNMDADELRKSMRRSKRGALPNLTLPPSVSVSGSQDSEDDDDDASTPSGENTDRNPMSMLSVSSESLDKLVSREKYLQSTFDNLSSTELDAVSPNKSSISSQYNRTAAAAAGGGPVRNMAVINAANKTKNDPEAAKKRQELVKSIADIKKKLENVGSKSPLKYSQSIHDLSHIPEKDKWSMSSHKQQAFVACTGGTAQNSASVPTDLQLCGCLMRDIAKHTSDINSLGSLYHQHSLPVAIPHQLGTTTPTKLSDILSKSPEKSQQHLAAMITPRKLKLDKTLNKYKHKSLPVSPVSEECRLSDFASANAADASSAVANQAQSFHGRKSFSYYVDAANVDEAKTSETDVGFKQICDDIEKFSKDFSRNYEQIEHIFQNSPTPLSYPSSFTEASNDVAKRKPLPLLLLKTEDDGDDSNFSSDSLEECSFKSTRAPKTKKLAAPRRCLSNNEIYNYSTEEIDYSKYFQNCDSEQAKSESFYLNPSNKNSQDSILSGELDDEVAGKSYCNSMESILSNDSDCKSAPLEILFASHRSYNNESTYSKSLPKSGGHSSNSTYAYENAGYEEQHSTSATAEMKRSQSMYSHRNRHEPVMKSSQTQTDINFETTQSSKKSNISTDFQRKLQKFESCSSMQNDVALNPVASKPVNKKGIAFFVQTETSSSTVLKDSQNTNPVSTSTSRAKGCAMYIPSLETKNKQYKSKFCNVLNNKPEVNAELFEGGSAAKPAFTLTKFNFDKSAKIVPAVRQETASLDRHLLSKSLTDCEKICHKPPKAVRRHSSKAKKSRTSYEYIRKEDFFKDRKLNNATEKKSNENLAPTSNEQCIEFSFKEKNLEVECENANNVVTVKTGCGRRDKLDNLYTEFYDSLDKVNLAHCEQDSLDYHTLRSRGSSERLFDSLDVAPVDPKNLWNSDTPDPNKLTDHKLAKTTDDSLLYTRIQQSLEQIKLLNDIQRRITQINELVEIVAENVSVGKVRALSRMFDNMSRSCFGQLSSAPATYRRRNRSLPNFVERHLVVSDIEALLMDEKSAKDALNLKWSQQQQQHVPDQEVSLDPASPDSSLRRACSLSDLSIKAPTPQKRKTEQSGKLMKNPSMSRVSGTSGGSNSNRYLKPTPILRSNSTTVLLPQSDSENEMGDSGGSGGGGLSSSRRNLHGSSSRLMQPTISSQNKVSSSSSTGAQNGKGSGSVGSNGVIRKRHSHSVANLTNLGQEDSSSEEVEKPILPVKPAVPPRKRDLASDLALRRISVMNKHRPKPMRVSYEKKKDDLDLTLTNDFEDTSNDIDVSTVELSTQLCDEVALQLTKAASNVYELYKRLTDSDSPPMSSTSTLNKGGMSGVQKTDMVKNLELSMARTQKMLQDLTLEKFRHGCGNMDVNQTDTVKKINDLVAKGFGSNRNALVDVMQQYSDILLGLMQQQIQNSSGT